MRSRCAVRAEPAVLRISSIPSPSAVLQKTTQRIRTDPPCDAGPKLPSLAGVGTAASQTDVPNTARADAQEYTSAMRYQMWHVETRNVMDDFDTETEALEAVR